MTPMDWATVNQLIASQRWMVANRVGASAMHDYMDSRTPLDGLTLVFRG